MQGRLFAIEDAFVGVAPPPPVEGMGTLGGFKMQIEDRGSLGYQELNRVLQDFLARANQTPGVTVPAGSRIPGIPRHQGTLALRWSPGPWQAALELQARSKVVVNDVGTFSAPGFGVWHAEVGRNWTLSGSTLRAFARIENLLDKTYVGSVIVNEGNQRFFEAAPERNALFGVQWSWR